MSDGCVLLFGHYFRGLGKGKNGPWEDEDWERGRMRHEEKWISGQ